MKRKPLLFWIFVAATFVGWAGLAICAFIDGHHYVALTAMAFLGMMGALFPGFHE